MIGEECVFKVFQFEESNMIPYGEYAIDTDIVEKIIIQISHMKY